MKKGLSLLVLLLSISALSLHAQLRHEQQSQIGVRLGANFSTIDDGVDNADWKKEEPRVAGINAGLAASFWMNNTLAFAPEINFSQRGYSVKMAGGPASPLAENTYTSRYNYLEVPLLLRATFGRQLVRGYVNAGPSVSFMLSGKEIVENSAGKTETSIDTEDKRYSLFEVGAAAGGGVHFNTRAGSFMLDFRYHSGLTNLQTEKFTIPAYSSGSEPDRYRNQYFSIGLIFLGPYRQ